MLKFNKPVRGRLLLVAVISASLAGSLASALLVGQPSPCVGPAVPVANHPTGQGGRLEPMAFDSYLGHKPGGNLLIEKGSHFLISAIKVLGHARGHFGGHRLAAIRDAKMALRECRLALKPRRH